MYIHSFLRKIDEGQYQEKQNCSLFAKLKKNIVGYTVKPFFYNVAGVNYTLEDIKHGMLRNNKKRQGDYSELLKNGDPKMLILGNSMENDPRINFVCLDFPDFVEHTEEFQGGKK
jgi:hypothetical protein